MPHTQRQVSADTFANETQGEQLYGYFKATRLCGFIAIWQPDWFIHHLYVDPAVQNSGIGQALLSFAHQMAGNNSLSLKCQLANKNALRFYQTAGFFSSNDCGEDEYGQWVRLSKYPTP